MAKLTKNNLPIGKAMGRLLHNPWIILLSMAAGIIIGNTHQDLAMALSPLGNIYLTLLQMCVLPIMITAVIVGLGNLFRTGKAALYLKRMIVIYGLGLCLVAVISLSIALLTKPGKQLTQGDKTIISEQLAKAETAKALEVEAKPNKTMGKIADFIANIVPANIFAAMSQGQNLAVLFFCLALGVALGKSKVEGANIILKVLEAANEALLMIVTWTMYGLPFGLCCLLAGYIAQTGLSVLVVLIKFILLYALISLIIMLINSLIIWRRSGHRYLQTWLALKEPLLIAFSTRSSFAAMPATLTNMHKKLKMDKQTVDLLVPVGIMLNPMGSVAHYCLVAVFMSQLYGLPFGLEQFMITIVTSIGASIAATGVPSIATLSLLPMVLNPLALPINVGMVLVAAVDTVTDTIVTMLNIHGSCATAALVADKQPYLVK